MERLYNMPHLATRLDLAMEATAVLRGAADIEIAGIAEEVEQSKGASVHTITILNEEGSRAINKPQGQYITVELPMLYSGENFFNLIELIAQKIGELLPPLEQGTLLIIGLGNDAAIADSLGPQVVARTYATRHIFNTGQAPDSLGRVCALAPGVLGVSGIETMEILTGLCQRLHPSAVIAVDSLASASVSRVGTTIQLTDSGLRPGSGVGRSRGELNAHTLGCPVAAIGVPTVVDSATIISETLNALAENWQQRGLEMPPSLDDEAREYAEKQLLSAFNGQLMVTPKDIDDLIFDQAEIIAAACAIYAHSGCTVENYRDFLR